MESKKVKIYGLVALGIVFMSGIFIFSYIKYTNGHSFNYLEKKSKEIVNPGERIEAIMVNAKGNEVLLPSADISRSIKYSKSAEVKNFPEEKAGKNLGGKNKQEVQEIYKKDGYNIIEFSKDRLVLEKEINSYTPGKYFYGEKDGVLVIFKVAENGVNFIETPKTDITNINIDMLGDEEKKMILNGDKNFQFETHAEALEGLADYHEFNRKK